MIGFVQDARFAVRTLRKAPGFTLTALAALALGIGANTAIFSVVNAVLLKPLTYPDPGRIMLFFVTSAGGPVYGASATKFNAWRNSPAFQDVSAYEYNGAQLNLTGGAVPEQVHGIRVSADYFRLLGAPVVQGRTFTAEEDRPNGGHVAVLSYGLWQRRFGGDPAIVGKPIPLSGTPYTVIGVVGPAFNTELDSPPDVFLPFQIDPASTDNAHYFNVIARLAPGVTIGMADAQLQVAAEQFRRQFPNMMGPRDGFAVQPYQDAMVVEVRPSLLVLAGAVGFVLLIACANVANLLLVRATGRKREMAIRAALGASRGRMIRQVLAESMALATGGGALGLLIGVAGVRALLALNPGNIPRIGEGGAAVGADWRVLAFTLGISTITGIVFGLAPAFSISRSDAATGLKESGGGRSGTGLRQNRTRALLVISETALALVLLIGAALLIRSFAALRAVDPGFDGRGVLTMRMSLAGTRFQKTAELNELIREAVPRLEAIPGVARAGVTYTLPLEGAFGVPFNIAGRPATGGQYDGRGWISVSPGYFDIFRIPVLRGRAFSQRDDGGAERVAIINQTMARRFWPAGDALGARVILGRGYGPEFEEPARVIIGVVGDVHNSGLDQTPGPVVYVPMAQVTDGITALANRAASLTWVARTHGAPLVLRTAVANELQQVSGGLPLGHIRSMDEVMSESTARASFHMLLLSIFGSAALLLAAIGIYGSMAYSVRQRTQELGIRMALGARTGQVRNMIVVQGMRLALTGIALGVAAAFAATRLIANFLFGVKAWDPMVFIAMPVFLGAVALFAVWLPAVRAKRIDPVVALRNE